MTSVVSLPPVIIWWHINADVCFIGKMLGSKFDLILIYSLSVIYRFTSVYKSLFYDGFLFMSYQKFLRLRHNWRAGSPISVNYYNGFSDDDSLVFLSNLIIEEVIFIQQVKVYKLSKASAGKSLWFIKPRLLNSQVASSFWRPFTSEGLGLSARLSFDPRRFIMSPWRELSHGGKIAAEIVCGPGCSPHWWPSRGRGKNLHAKWFIWSEESRKAWPSVLLLAVTDPEELADTFHWNYVKSGPILTPPMRACILRRHAYASAAPRTAIHAATPALPAPAPPRHTFCMRGRLKYSSMVSWCSCWKDENAKGRESFRVFRYKNHLCYNRIHLFVPLQLWRSLCPKVGEIILLSTTVVLHNLHSVLMTGESADHYLSGAYLLCDADLGGVRWRTIHSGAWKAKKFWFLMKGVLKDDPSAKDFDENGCQCMMFWDGFCWKEFKWAPTPRSALSIVLELLVLFIIKLFFCKCG